MSKLFGGIIGCKYTKSLHGSIQTGFPDGSNSGSTVYYTREKPTVMLYTYINRHAGTPDKNKTKAFLLLNKIGLLRA